LITEVAEKMQAPLRGTGFQCLGLIIDVNPTCKAVLEAFDEKGKQRHQHSIAPEKETSEKTHISSLKHLIDKGL